MSNLDARIILIDPDGNTIFKETKLLAYTRLLTALGAYAVQGMLHKSSEEEMISNYPAFETIMSHRLVDSHCYSVTTSVSRIPEGKRRKPRAIHQAFVVPSRTTMMLFGHQPDVRETLARFPPGEACLILADNWAHSQQKKKRDSSVKIEEEMHTAVTIMR